MSINIENEPVRRPSVIGPGLLIACAALWVVLALAFMTVVNGYPLSVVLAGAWWLLAYAWVRLPFLSSAAVRSRPWRRLWLTAGAIVVPGAVLAMTDVGLMARLYLCEPQVAAYVASVAPGTSDYRHEPRGVGLFQVVGTREYHGDVELWTSPGFMDISHHGLVYAPEWAAAPSGGKIKYWHVYGPWYAFRGWISS
jgi:hypothetical protein